MKSTIKRILAFTMAIAVLFSLPCVAGAATADTAVIDTTATGSVSLYKYDLTSAAEEGVYDASFVATGLPDSAVEQLYAPYAIEGVEYTYLRLAEITTYTEETAADRTTIVLYGFEDNNASADLLNVLGMDEEDAYRIDDDNVMWFTSDALNNALADALQHRETATKNALEGFMCDYNGTTMPVTNANGHTEAKDLELGLYLIVETLVPENVTDTTAPFFVSVPMTTVDGDEWNYDITVYPKNQTGEPTLAKTVREAADDTGKNNGDAADIDDGYNAYASASEGDVVEYQIISRLPSITSDATALTTYTFADTLSKGMEYNKSDVKLEWFSDEECTELLATWTETDEVQKFTVSYGTGENNATTMTVAMTAAGLTEINTSDALYTEGVFRGYSDCFLRITYAATVNSTADTVLGKDGNPNTVQLTWKRTNMDYWDTLEKSATVYTFGIDLTKQFSDNAGDLAEVEFVVHNDTDDYWVVARYNADEGVYYVTGHSESEDDATHFVPSTDTSRIVLYGVEDDTYSLTEVATDDGYVLLTAPVEVSISTAFVRVPGSNLRVSAVVNGNTVSMLSHGSSVSAFAPLTVINTNGFKLPVTGDSGVWIYSGIGIALMGISIAAIFLLTRKKKEKT